MDSGPLVQANNPSLREMQPAGADFGTADQHAHLS